MGCGLTTTAGIFEELGAVVIYADKIARELSNPYKPGWQKIKDGFGDDYFSPDQKLDRQKLGRLVFSQPAALEKLNKLIHPLIIEEIKKRIECWQDTDKVVILEAPLLIEVGLDKIVDKLVVLNVPFQVRLEWLQERDGLEIAEIEKRIKTQIPLETKLKMADEVIDNTKTINILKDEVAKKWQEWLKTE